jgi:hypothetical protein
MNAHTLDNLPHGRTHEKGIQEQQVETTLKEGQGLQGEIKARFLLLDLLEPSLK